MKGTIEQIGPIELYVPAAPPEGIRARAPTAKATAPGKVKVYLSGLYVQRDHLFPPGTKGFSECTTTRNGKIVATMYNHYPVFSWDFKGIQLVSTRCRAREFDKDGKPHNIADCKHCQNLKDYILDEFAKFKVEEERRTHELRAKVDNLDKKYDPSDVAIFTEKLGKGRRCLEIEEFGIKEFYDGRKVGGYFEVKRFFPTTKYTATTMIQDLSSGKWSPICRLELRPAQAMALVEASTHKEHLELHGLYNTVHDKKIGGIAVEIEVIEVIEKKGFAPTKKFIVKGIEPVDRQWFTDHGFTFRSTEAKPAEYVAGAAKVREETPTWALYVLRLSAGNYEDLNTEGHVLSYGLTIGQSMESWLDELVKDVFRIAKKHNDNKLADYANTAQNSMAQLATIAIKYLEAVPEADRADRKFRDCDRRLRVPNVLR